MWTKKADKEFSLAPEKLGTEPESFTVYVHDSGDPSVGIPGIHEPITIVFPKYFIPEDQHKDFIKSFKEFLASWQDTTASFLSEEEQKKMEEDENAMAWPEEE